MKNATERRETTRVGKYDMTVVVAEPDDADEQIDHRQQRIDALTKWLLDRWQREAAERN